MVFIKKCLYENVIAECSHCGKENIYNRNELKTKGIIFHEEVECEYCGQKFSIGGDICNNPDFSKIFYEAYYLKENKDFGAAIIKLCSAYENMFYHSLIYFLICKPLDYNCCCQNYESRKNLEMLKELLNTKIEKYTFVPMFYQFIKIVIRTQTKPINNVEDAKNYIENINEKKYDENCIKNINNEKIRNTILDFIKYYNSDISINKIRNKIVHKYGYRPTLEDVKIQIENAYKFLDDLPCLLKLINVDYPEL